MICDRAPPEHTVLNEHTAEDSRELALDAIGCKTVVSDEGQVLAQISHRVDMPRAPKHMRTTQWDGTAHAVLAHEDIRFRPSIRSDILRLVDHRAEDYRGLPVHGRTAEDCRGVSLDMVGSRHGTDAHAEEHRGLYRSFNEVLEAVVDGETAVGRFASDDKQHLRSIGHGCTAGEGHVHDVVKKTSTFSQAFVTTSCTCPSPRVQPCPMLRRCCLTSDLKRPTAVSPSTTASNTSLNDRYRPRCTSAMQTTGRRI